MQFPVNDPGELIPALAYATEQLGFILTQDILQEHPYALARKLSSLDHLSRGRVGWNIVTTFLPGAGRNLGFGGLPEHGDRYARADDFVEVIYKLLEASWEDDAVIRDKATRQYSDPAKVHEINHAGPFYSVAGPHLCEPSPQRTPVLVQAGVSPGTFEDFVEQVAPELRRREIMRPGYAAGTLREKLFPWNGPYRPDEHPARAIRRAAFGLA